MYFLEFLKHHGWQKTCGKHRMCYGNLKKSHCVAHYADVLKKHVLKMTYFFLTDCETCDLCGFSYVRKCMPQSNFKPYSLHAMPIMKVYRCLAHSTCYKCTI